MSENANPLWLVGKITNWPAYEFQGIFDSEERAVSECKGELWFVAPVYVNQVIPEETSEWPGMYYPEAENG